MSETTGRESETSGSTKVAIACQGGGSHTAFTAGVLQKLFAGWTDEYELVGISGSSGGAFNALVAWFGLVTGDEEKAIGLLGDLWEDISAKSYSDRWLNSWVSGYSALDNSGLPVPQISPYQVPGPSVGRERIRSVLDRHVDFDELPALCGRDAPELVVGTVDLNGGVFETFTNENVTTEAVLASAAVPNLFEAVEINDHLHWDGLFSQNPPIDDLLTVDVDRKPDELWVIQINPQTREGTPTTLEEIADRRNELSGNISLNQELRFVERVNEWIDQGHLPESKFSRTTIRRITIPKNYNCSTKLDRSPEFIEELLELGHRSGTEFIETDDVRLHA
jgi:NTE family protein